MKPFLTLSFAITALVSFVMPAAADQAAIDAAAAIQLQQQTLQQIQQQQQFALQQQQQQQQQYSYAVAGIQPYCNWYGTSRTDPYGAGPAGARPGMGVEPLLPGLFGETPGAARTAEDAPDASNPAPHRRHHGKTRQTARDVSTVQ